MRNMNLPKKYLLVPALAAAAIGGHAVGHEIGNVLSGNMRPNVAARKAPLSPDQVMASIEQEMSGITLPENGKAESIDIMRHSEVAVIESQGHTVTIELPSGN
jgi:hypothetical protein